MTKFTLISKKQEIENVYTLLFKSNTKLEYQAGQYIHIFIPSVLFNFGKPVREFSFSSSPTEPNYKFTINTSSGSKYQQQIRSMEIGDTVYGFKIGGHLTVAEDCKNILMIAQGVGIAPFRSILMSLDDLNSRNITLIHIAKNQHIFREELSELPIKKLLITRNDFAKTLSDTIKTNKNFTFYIAGATNFVESTSQTLLAQGVASTQIQLDKFKGLSDS